MATQKTRPKRKIASPRTSKEAEEVAEISRRMLRYASAGPARIDFLREVSKMLMEFSRCDAVELVRHVHENFKNIEIMTITGYPSISGAVDAVKSGAEQYLAKPLLTRNLFSAVHQALDKLRMRRAAQTPPYRTPRAPQGLVGESPAMQKVLNAIAKAAPTPATVLITGESGTGKELVARAIHYSSPRAAAPFLPVSCAAIPEGLLESELFGYVKGAFTGAAETRAGFFQTADGGTIFLDEISSASLPTTGKATPRAPGQRSLYGRLRASAKSRCQDFGCDQPGFARLGEEGDLSRRPLLSTQRDRH
jgi:transcriptional regulator with AAA-type ATPase domain